MAALPSQYGWQPQREALAGGPAPGFRDRLPGPALALAAFSCLLVLQGAALTRSYLFAAPLLAFLIVALAVDLPLVLLLGVAFLGRVLTDDLASATSRHSSSLNPSALVAGLLILLAVGLIARRRRGVVPALAIGTWVALWTGVAVHAQGLSTLAIREGLREMSILAVAVIVVNSRGKLNMGVVTRLIQAAGAISALIALYQLGTHSGVDVAGQVRSNGTFAHPNDAAVYFAIATMASLWQYIDNGRRRLDLGLVLLFSAATISTFSLGGFFSLLVMIGAFGLMRSGSRRLKIGACALAGVLLVTFLATPLGSERLASESTTELGGSHRSASGNSLEWRLYKWETLIPEWEQAPWVGRGLGATVTAEATSQNTTVGNLPHSEYVRYLVETGAVGVATLLLTLAWLIRRLRRRRRRADPRNIAALGLAVAIGLLVDGLAANTVLYTPAAYAAAMLIAAALTARAAEGGLEQA